MIRIKQIVELQSPSKSVLEKMLEAGHGGFLGTDSGEDYLVKFDELFTIMMASNVVGYVNYPYLTFSGSEDYKA